MTDLLRCPFCGGEAVLTDWSIPFSDPYDVVIDCASCGAQLRGPFAGTPELARSAATAAWNRRVGNCAWESHPGVEMRFDGEKWVEVKE